MKSLLIYLATALSAISAWGQEISKDFERGIQRLEYCDIVYNNLNSFAEYKSPSGYWFWNKTTYLQQHDLYKRNVLVLKRSPVYKEMESQMREPEALALFNRCESGLQSWLQLAKQLSPYFPECQEIVQRFLNKDGTEPKADVEQARKGIIQFKIRRQAENARVSGILQRMTEIESVYSEVNYFVTLVMKKVDEVSESKNYWNDQKAVHQEIPIGKSNYDRYSVGQTLSRKFDGAGVLKEDSERASYVVMVGSKRFEIKYFVKYKAKPRPESVTEYEFNKVADSMSKEYIERLNAYELFGRRVYTLLDLELRSYHLKEIAAVVHEVASMKIFNETSMNGDFLKMYRNADLVHYIEVEVPSKKQIGFSTGINSRNVLMTGHLSQMHGQVESTRMVTNPNLFYAKTQEGPVLVLNRNQLKDFGVTSLPYSAKPVRQ